MRFAGIVILAASAAMAQAPVPAGPVSRTWGQGAAMTPADTLDRLDRFRDGLSRADRSRLDRVLPRSADGGIARCDGVEGSRAACEAAAYMPALRATGLMPRFLKATRF